MDYLRRVLLSGILLLLPITLTPGAVCAETVIIGDFWVEDLPAGTRDVFSIGLQYCIARLLNRSGHLDAISPTSSASHFARRMYTEKGIPKQTDVRELCARFGADRCLMGRCERHRGEAGGYTVTFYFQSRDGGHDEVFKAAVSGALGLPELAAYAARKIDRSSASDLSPHLTGELLPVLARTLRMLREGNLQSAAVEANTFGAAFPASADAWYLRGLVSMRTAQPYQALRFFNEAGTRDAYFAYPPYQEGRVWLSLSRSTLAEAAFELAARIQPSFYDALLQAGSLKVERGDYQGGLKLLEKARLVRPSGIEARVGIANALMGQGKKQDATATVEKIVAESPACGQAQLLLGKIMFEAGDYANAERHLRNAVRFLPDEAEAHRLLGESLSRQGGYNRHSEAILELGRALELSDKKKAAAH